MKFRVRDLSLTVLCAACYSGLVYFLAPISFMMVQVRVADALTGLVPVLGVPAVFGIALGVFIGNLYSPLGPIDLLSALPSLLGLWTLYKLRRTSVLLGLLSYSLAVSLWVAFILYYITGAPYLIAFIYVFAGVTIASVGLGYLLYRYVSKIEVFKSLSRNDR
ncbi:QueT transporter family protein [Candidatus Bathyarchaeota archaeon]|nr:QueT transporter family protein [Candidatus Bathyarchaeota archaeon]